MKGRERRTKEMGVRVVLYCERRPDTDPAHGVLVGKLKGVVEQMEQEEGLQRSALMDRHTSSLDKERLRHELLDGPIAHVVGVADLARKDEPTLASQVQYRPSGRTFGGHLAAARGLLAEAETHQELLAKFGLSAGVLDVYRELLSQSDAAVRLGDEGRAAHKGATPHLQELAKEIRQIVRTLDGRNRIRFKNDTKLLEEWISASTVLGKPGPVSGSEPAESPGAGPTQGSASGAQSQGSAQGGTPAAGGDVRPAASVVEFDAATGDAKVGGATFESYVGKFIDPALPARCRRRSGQHVHPRRQPRQDRIVKGLKSARRRGRREILRPSRDVFGSTTLRGFHLQRRAVGAGHHDLIAHDDRRVVGLLRPARRVPDLHLAPTVIETRRRLATLADHLGEPVIEVGMGRCAVAAGP